MRGQKTELTGRGPLGRSRFALNSNNNNNYLVVHVIVFFVICNARCKTQIRRVYLLSETAPYVHTTHLQSALKRKTLENRYYKFYVFRFMAYHSNIFQRV